MQIYAKKNTVKNYKTVYKHLMKINMKSCHHFFTNIEKPILSLNRLNFEVFSEILIQSLTVTNTIQSH